MSPSTQPTRGPSTASHCWGCMLRDDAVMSSLISRSAYFTSCVRGVEICQGCHDICPGVDIDGHLVRRNGPLELLRDSIVWGTLELQEMK